ncbi:MAG: hypothetical protein FJZ00_01420 [Candidatus Sericytochromatia bacterium]|uniref:Uncharacterized protein n=1 Tax=Candidatus Tanganyikabacteria bacterium TaxID=2961651 RepID=A0A938BM03_9BACT|nr:hypothetical protein [Candidatus Tanganyikabacteria bacterium]
MGDGAGDADRKSSETSEPELTRSKLAYAARKGKLPSADPEFAHERPITEGLWPLFRPIKGQVSGAGDGTTRTA